VCIPADKLSCEFGKFSCVLHEDLARGTCLDSFPTVSTHDSVNSSRLFWTNDSFKSLSGSKTESSVPTSSDINASHAGEPEGPHSFTFKYLPPVSPDILPCDTGAASVSQSTAPSPTSHVYNEAQATVSSICRLKTVRSTFGCTAVPCNWSLVECSPSRLIFCNKPDSASSGKNVATKKKTTQTLSPLVG
jgi:hypothetical protein